ncbi:MAG: MBL fold metallo-hydrolase [Bacteroidetes bacterium]|nr:MBL fold metallo-hydrolase [Bacteroidota bacterium]
MKIGKYKVVPIESGRISLDGGAMFGIIPKPLWQKTNPSDELNRILLSTRCLLLKSENKNVLIDTGIGKGWDEKFEKIYGVDHSEFTLMNSLKEAGVESANITDVIITHLHFDHTGGSVEFIDGKIVPAFPNAVYHVQKSHFEWACNPSTKDKASFIENRFIPLAKEGILNLLDNQTEFDDEINFIILNGHSYSQQLVKVSDSSTTLLYCADLMPTSSHIPIPYVMGYDLQPVKTIEEKLKLLPQAVDEEWILFFEHDPYMTAGRVGISEKGFYLKERIDTF